MPETLITRTPFYSAYGTHYARVNLGLLTFHDRRESTLPPEMRIPRFLPNSHGYALAQTLLGTHWGENFQGKRALELGCRYPYFLLFLRQQHGCRVIGMEIDRKSARVGREAGINMILGDASGRAPLPFADGSLDIVISMLLFERSHRLFNPLSPHISDFHSAMARIKRILSPGGIYLSIMEDTSESLARTFPRLNIVIDETDQGSCLGTAAFA